MVLSAIRNLDGAEINGRKMRVSFTNTSGLKDVAKALGHDVPDPTATLGESPAELGTADAMSSGSVSIKDVVNTLSPSEAYDLLAEMKGYIAEDMGVRAKQLFKEFPQLTTAFSEIQLKLGMGLGLSAADLNMQHGAPQPSSAPVPHQLPPPGYQQPPPQPPFAPPQQQQQQQQQQFYPPPPNMPQPPYMPGHLLHDHWGQGPPPPMPPNMPFPPPPRQPHHMGPSNMPRSDEDLLYQVMNMTDYELSMLPDADRMQMMQLRESLMQGGGGIDQGGPRRY